MKRHLFIAILLLSFSVARAGDTLLQGSLLERISLLQVKEHGAFPRGLFPSYRMYLLNRTREKADVNIFFTGLINFTLQRLRPEFTPSQQQSIDRILADSRDVFDKFKSRRGRDTYHFWPSDTPQIFPNSGWMNRFDRAQSLPDDMDDTVISLLALNAPDSVARKVHELMQVYTNNASRRIRNTFPAYRHLNAYSTWFGKKMPVDFDVCVLSNVLYFVQQYGLKWTSADSASLQLIENVIRAKQHLTHASYVATHYGKPSIIFYHVARLMSLHPLPSLEALKPQLVEQAKEALRNSKEFMDQVILSTALLRWGVQPQPAMHNAGSLTTLIEENQFSFFNAKIASMMPDPFKQWLDASHFGSFDYHCEAYNYTLVLEYLVLQNRFNKSSNPIVP